MMKAAVIWLSVWLCPIALADKSCEPSALSMLPTNDDGIATVGIEEMHRALVDTDHSVKRIAPDRNYSGSGTSLTLKGITVEDMSSEELPNVFSVSGSPATSVILGATALFQSEEAPDLIVSGINDSPNIGASLTESGTVGAVITGLNLLHPAVPGIAIRTQPVNKDSQSAEYREHFRNVAGFVARIVHAIACDGSPIMGTRQALNINYPPSHPYNVSGVRLAKQGKLLAPWLGYAINEDGQYGIRLLSESEAASDFADITLFRKGYITITVIDGDHTSAPRFDTEQILTLIP